ncbi:MAG: hypothetical protein NVS1B10_08720 [Candidatus Saccharimonadales bacterium]
MEKHKVIYLDDRREQTAPKVVSILPILAKIIPFPEKPKDGAA